MDHNQSVISIFFFSDNNYKLEKFLNKKYKLKILPKKKKKTNIYIILTLYINKFFFRNKTNTTKTIIKKSPIIKKNQKK